MRFPALWLAREGSFDVVDEPLKTCSTVAYRNGFFDGLRFYDSAGIEWVIDAVTLRRPISLLDRMLNRPKQIELELASHGENSPAEIAELLCACIDRDRNDIHTQFVPAAELKARLRSAQSPSELIQFARNLGADKNAHDTV